MAAMNVDELSNPETYQLQEACIFAVPAPVRARSMTLGAYLELRKWTPRGDEMLNSKGFLVEHPDWGPPNHPDFPDFISWIPEQQFLLTYDKVPETMH